MDNQQPEPEQNPTAGQEPAGGNGQGNPTTPPVEQSEGNPDTNPQGEANADNGQEPDPAIKKANREAANYRTQLREQEKKNAALESKLNDLLGGLGKLTGTSKETSPEDALKQAQAEREEAQAKLREMEQEILLGRAGKEAGADMDLLLPFLRGTGALKELDPTAADYADQVSALVKATVDSNPKLKTTVVPSSSGNTQTPTSNSGLKDLNQEDLQRMFDNGQHAEINKAFSEGRFKF